MGNAAEGDLSRAIQEWKPYDAELQRSWDSMERRVAWAEEVGAKAIEKEGFEKFEQVKKSIAAYRSDLLNEHREFLRRNVEDWRLITLEASLPPKKRRLAETTPIRNSSIVSVHFEDCKEQVIWREELVKPGIPRAIVSLDELLDEPRPLVAQLRWLHLLLYEAKHADLTDVVNMRKGRSKGENDKELEYHPLLLKFMEAAAGGQPHISFHEEAHQGGAREDMCTSILGGTFYESHEVKAAFALARRGEPATGIEKNVMGISKIYKANKKYAGPSAHLGVFAVRCEYLWFVKFRYEQSAVAACEVAPEFPCAKVWEMSNTLCELALLDAAEEGSKLIELCPAEPTPGFKLLVRYVDTLCSMYNITKAPVELEGNDGGETIPLDGAFVVGQGYKSVVLRLPGEDSVIKVSDCSRIKREAFIHERVDGARNIRPMRRGQRWGGQVCGAGDGLEWLTLEGFGRPVTQDDVRFHFQSMWRQASIALAELHSRGVLHRDIKPSNMLMFNGDQLWLNDFDCSCLVGESLEIRSVRVGAPYFESPLFDEHRGFLYRDDWYSLVLTFLDLSGWYDGGDKASALSDAAASSNFPHHFRACVDFLLDVGDGKFSVHM